MCLLLCSSSQHRTPYFLRWTTGGDVVSKPVLYYDDTLSWSHQVSRSLMFLMMNPVHKKLSQYFLIATSTISVLQTELSSPYL